jgi:hypothetical protein
MSLRRFKPMVSTPPDSVAIARSRGFEVPSEVVSIKPWAQTGGESQQGSSESAAETCDDPWGATDASKDAAGNPNPRNLGGEIGGDGGFTAMPGIQSLRFVKRLPA